MGPPYRDSAKRREANKPFSTSMFTPKLRWSVRVRLCAAHTNTQGPSSETLHTISRSGNNLQVSKRWTSALADQRTNTTVAFCKSGRSRLPSDSGSCWVQRSDSACSHTEHTSKPSRHYACACLRHYALLVARDVSLATAMVIPGHPSSQLMLAAKERYKEQTNKLVG
jgi:hypothetical protein